MMFLMVLFWILVIVGIVFLVRWLAVPGTTSHPTAPPAAETPLEILQKRYARGEISKEQYDQMRRDLESG